MSFSLSPQDTQALWLTLQLAAISTLILLCLCVPLAWALARAQSKWVVLLDAIFALPLVLPPTVLGFYLLIAFAPDSWLGGAWLALTGQSLAFSFEGILLGSVIYSLPFVLQPLKNGFLALDKQVLELAQSYKVGRLTLLSRIIWPMIRPAFISASTLGFAHTLGEFGVVLMIGGNIAGETQVVSIALYDHVESLQFTQAHQLSAVLLLISFVILVASYWNQKRHASVF